MTVKDLISSYYKGYSGTGEMQVLSVSVIDECGEIVLNKMRAEMATRLIDPNLEIDEWRVTMGKSHRITHNGNIRQSIILTIFVSICQDMPHYYSDEEWERLQRGETV